MDDPEIIRIEQSRMLAQGMELIMGARQKHPDEVCADIALSPDLIAAFCNMPAATFAPIDAAQDTPGDPGPTLK